MSKPAKTSLDRLDTLKPIPPSRILSGTEKDVLYTLDHTLDAGISIFDADQTYQFMSAGMMRQLNISPGEVKVGDKLTTIHSLMVEKGLLTPEIIEKNALSPEEQALRDSSEVFSSVMELADGRTMKLTRRKLPTGQTVSISRDISELVEKDDLLEDAMFLGKSGYWIYDFKTKTTRLSKTITEFFPPETLDRIYKHGMNVIVVAEDRQILPAAVKGALNGDGRFRATTRLYNPSGGIRIQQTTGEILRDENGKPSRIRAFVKDVTRQHRINSELERAKDDAIHASKAKSEFLANMSHEIRTPMNGILGMAELLSNSNIDAQQKELVKVISNSAEALLTIINDILDFSKIEAGALILDPVPFDLREAVNDVAALFSQSLKDKGLELIINYSPTAERNFIADPGRVRQILTNLVGNAVKFTTKGHILIDIDVRDARENLKVVKIDVTDTGIGIKPEKLGAIFNKFTQADGSTTRLYGGTGLGLSITKCLVEMMSGKVSVKSTYGEGTTFTFALPLPVDTEHTTYEFDTTVLKGKLALVVDDVAINRHILREHLGNWDIEVIEAEDGLAAINALKEAKASGRKFDIILTDFLMPDMDGAQLAAAISTDQTLDYTPIIMLSSCDQPLTSDELGKIGIENFQVKPLRERRLYDALIKTLATYRVADAEEIWTPTESTATPDESSKTEILVAEDFELNRDVVRLMLSDSDYEPIFAENGQIALETYKENPDRFPVILMDVSMPIMDGYKTTRAIAAFEAENGLPHTPVIALTGHALKNDKEKCFEAGMDDYLSKPVKQNILISKLNGWMLKLRQAA